MKVLLVSLFFLLSVNFLCQTVKAQTLIIRNVTVIDMTGAAPKTKITVEIVGGLITRISRSSTTTKNALVIDGTGKFLIPSFWDMHVHVLNSDRMLPLFVANGVLGVRDLGVHDLDEILRFRQEAAAGTIISPRIVTAGKILDGVPQADPSYSYPIKTADEGRKAVRDLKARGVDLIKVYDVLPRDAYFAIADEAKKLGLHFVGHVPTLITTMEAVYAGQKSIEHLGKIIEDSSNSPEKVRAAQAKPIKEGDYFAFTTRFGEVYDTLLATYDVRKARKEFAAFRKYKTWQAPTLAIKYGRTYIDELDAKGDPRAKYVEPSQVNYWKPSVNFFSRYRTPSFITAQKKYFQKQLDIVREMSRSGVGILASTDAPNPYVIAGFSLHDELALQVKAGLTPIEALITATRNPVEYLGELKTSGTIEKGKIANLILLDANPLENIANTTRINAVIQNGRYLSRQDLDKILADVEAAAKKK
ncbi:MAG: amidohydrolase family protein [Pyrinomonadaceae bacterium]